MRSIKNPVRESMKLDVGHVYVAPYLWQEILLGLVLLMQRKAVKTEVPWL